MKPIYILGAGNFAQEVYSEVFLQGDASKYGLFGGYIHLSNLDNPILTDLEGESLGFNFPKEASFILATGVKKWRHKFCNIFTNRYPKTDEFFPNVLADSANISPLASYGIGNVFLWNSLVRANAYLGDFNLLNAGSMVHHDVVLGNNNVLLPQSQILGDSSMKDNNVLASSAVVVTKIKMGSDNTISAGEVLFDNLEDRKFFQSGYVVDKP